MRTVCFLVVLALISTHAVAMARPPENPAGAVPTGPPNAENQEPAFPGQTRAPQMDSGVSLQVREVVTGLEHPWAIEFLPDGRLLITERSGNLRIVTQQGEVSAPIKGVPEVDSRGQGGLLDVMLAPDFAESRMVYLSYAESRPEGETGTSVARGRLSEDATALQNVEVIFRQMPSWDSTLHYGSRLVWGEDGLLYITLGERFLPESRELAQDITTHLGKVVRVTAQGEAPASNPFAGPEKGRDKIWSYGHRNIQAAALHPETGQLWTIGHGPQGGDELNIPQAGKNYGWPVISYGETYSGEPIGEGITQKAGMEQPIYYWDPVIAPSGMIFYQGDMFEKGQDDILVGSLTPGALVRLELDGKQVVGEERLLKDVGRVRDVAEGPDGSLWLVTDTDNGRLLHITLKERRALKER